MLKNKLHLMALNPIGKLGPTIRTNVCKLSRFTDSDKQKPLSFNKIPSYTFRLNNGAKIQN